MCKYLLKRKFPRDIYSWFITSYIWGCLDSIPGAEFFSRCTESILHSFVFRAASANRKESVVGEKRTCLSRQNTSLLYKHLHVSTKKKSIPHSGIKMHTSEHLGWGLHDWHTCECMAVRGKMERPAVFLRIGAAIYLVGSGHVSCVGDARSESLYCRCHCNCNMLW